MHSTTRTLSMLTLVPVFLLGASTSLLAQEDAGEMQEEAAQAEHEADIEAAAESAASWLQLVDEGDYEASFETAAEILQNQVTLEQWTTTIGQARGQIDPVGERTRTDARYTTDIPGAPAGEYVLLRYSTEASGDRTVGETVAQMKQADGSWKVVGYFVQP